MRSARSRSQRASAARSPSWRSPQGMRRLRDDGLAKIKEGLTTIPEVVRVTGSS